MTTAEYDDDDQQKQQELATPGWRLVRDATEESPAPAAVEDESEAEDTSEERYAQLYDQVRATCNRLTAIEEDIRAERNKQDHAKRLKQDRDCPGEPPGES